MALDKEYAEDLQETLNQIKGFGHLRVKKRGTSLTVFSLIQHDSDPILHARLTLLDRKQWGLSLPRHTGKWERTPFTGTMEKLVELLTTELSFHLRSYEA